MFDKKKGDHIQDILELGQDTDVQTCERLGGKKGKDGICRVIDAGIGDDGDIHLKATKKGSI